MVTSQRNRGDIWEKRRNEMKENACFGRIEGRKHVLLKD
jgi:hypothetical protein